MSEFLYQLDKLKNQFLENSTDVDPFLEARVKFNIHDETTVGPI